MTTYVTVAIPYVNAEPHLGYAYELIEADVYARARRQAGDDVRFLGGTDDYSLKNVVAAEAAGVPIRQFVDAHARRFAALAEPLQLSFDDFIRTSADPRHRPAVERLWRACAANGDLYRRTYEGLYCVGCEQFYGREELDIGDDGIARCREHGAPVEGVAETNWFFRLSAYQQHVERVIASGELEVHPRAFGDEVLAFVGRGLQDVSVSRSVERARGWGIPVPGDETQVIYVWFDALVNYISALDFGDPASAAYRRWWLEADRRVHVIGKGITRFHAVYWPAFLASAGQPAPTRIEVHPYLTVDGAKLSKSGGATVSPRAVVDRYGADALRWWCASDVGPVADTDFTEQRLVARANDDLANGIGNVAARVAALARLRAIDDRAAPPPDVAGLEEEVLDAISSFDLRRGSLAIRDGVAAVNRRLEAEKPWQEPKAALGHLLAGVRVIARAVRPIVPALAARVDALLDGRDGPVQPRLSPGSGDHVADLQPCAPGRRSEAIPLRRTLV